MKSIHKRIIVFGLVLMLSIIYFAPFKESVHDLSCNTVRDLSCTRYDIYVKLYPDEHYLFGRVILEGELISRNPTTLYLNPSLKIKRISCDEKPLSFNRSGYEISIQNPEKKSLLIEYEGKVLSKPVGSFVQSLQGKYRYCYVDNPASFLMAEEIWYPQPKNCVDTGKISVDVPEGEIVIAPGILEKVNTIRGRSVFLYLIQEPVFGISVSAGVYTEHRFNDSFEISVYSLPNSKMDIKKVEQEARSALMFYSEKLGRYPHQKFSIIDTTRYPGGHSDLSFVTINFDFVQNYWRLTLVHELAHQWFGNGVCPESHWQIEGGAHFSSYYYLYNTGSLIPYLEREGGNIEEGCVINSSEKSIVYYKSTAVFDMLRYIVGDDVFFTAIQNYIAKYPISNLYRPTDKDLQEVFEDVYGEDLSWFFDEWLHRADCPSYQIEDIKYDNNKVKFVIKQEGNFIMPVEVRIANEKEDIIKRIWVKSDMTFVTIESSSRPTIIEIDPANHILKEKQKGAINMIEKTLIKLLKKT
jgi:hypothetical protein